MNKAVFLDRDGIVNIDNNYVYKVEDFEFCDGIFKVLQKFQKLGYLLIIITNQAGIARGFYDENDFFKLTEWMISKLYEHDIEIKKVYFCPHHPSFTGKCDCRKPNNGMILQAKDEFKIDLSNSILIGDKESDIEAGIKSGIDNTILVTQNSLFSKSKFKVNSINNVLDVINGIRKI